MTLNASYKKTRLNFRALYPPICLLLAIFMLFFSQSIKNGVAEGLTFSFTTIVPTLFPFFILSDLWAALFVLKADGRLSRLFERFFHINGTGIVAFLSGAVCGFPVGVKMASELYKANKISKDEYERLSGFVNNPSAAFIISGVGLGIIGDIKVGIFIYISILLSAVTVGILFRPKRRNILYSKDISRQSFILVNSVKCEERRITV